MSCFEKAVNKILYSNDQDTGTQLRASKGDKPGGLAASGYGNPLYGYFTNTYKTYYGYNYMSLYEGKHEKYFFYSQTVKTGQTFVWNPLMHQEEEFKFPTYNRNHAITPLYIEFDIITAWRGLVNAAVKTAVRSAAKKGGELAMQFGKTPNQIYHTFRHTDALGLLDRALVQSSIQNHFKTVSSQVVTGKPFNQVIEIGGKKTQYTAYKLSDGTFNIGRIHGIK